MLPPTRRLYWEDDHCIESTATILAIQDQLVAFDQTCFYPGGGGQPPDKGRMMLENDEVFAIEDLSSGDGDVLWHRSTSALPARAIGSLVRLTLDASRRIALALYHTVLHVLNTIALNDYGAWITGAQIGADYSRIDFKIEGFSADLVREMEKKVNEVLDRNHTLRAYSMPEAEFAKRPDLLRTLEVKPPVRNGCVRVVAIEGFDEQACGGTHVHSTGELGRFEIYKTNNKGKINKRLYVKLHGSA